MAGITNIYTNFSTHFFLEWKRNPQAKAIPIQDWHADLPLWLRRNEPDEYPWGREFNPSIHGFKSHLRHFPAATFEPPTAVVPQSSCQLAGGHHLGPLEQWGQLNKLIHAQHLVQGRTHSRRLISARESMQRRPKRQQEKEPLISTEFQTTCFLLYPASTLPNVKKAINTH